jgi:hypothetical protein
MPTMTIFEPLFLLLALVTVLTLLTALGYGLFGRFGRAWRVLRGWLIGAAIYMAMVIVVSAFTPKEYRQIGEQKCFDDFCLTVDNVVRDAPDTYIVQLTLSNRARGTAQFERGTNLYLFDSTGRQYAPIEAVTPFEQPMQPGESLHGSRKYTVSPEATHLQVAYLHDRGFPIGWFIIGENRWIHGAGVWWRVS